MAHFIKGNLLDVEVTEKQKIPLIENDIWYEKGGGNRKRQQKGRAVHFLLAAEQTALHGRKTHLASSVCKLGSPAVFRMLSGAAVSSLHSRRIHK